MLLDLEKSKILLNSNCGYEFEFFSNLSLNDTKKSLEKALNKKIHVEDKAHSDFTPDSETFKIEPDYSGGANLIELITGPLKYADARIMMIKIFKWIQKNGYTTDRAGIHLNLSFNKDLYGNNFLSQMNPLKFILDFDEEYVYKYFPDRRNSVYAKSIKFIEPIYKQSYYFTNQINAIDFKIPDKKYYGVNFLKLQKNYIEFRYLGGKDYEKKLDLILNMMDHFLLSLFSAASKKEFTYQNKVELMRILRKHEDVNLSYISYDNFRKYFPQIGFLVDLDTDIRRLKLYWNNVRDKIYEVLTLTDLRKGLINYDSDTSRLQLKDIDLKQCYELKNVDIIDSKIHGTLYNCDIFNTILDNVELWKCNIFNSSKMLNCRIDNTYINRSCFVKDSFVSGEHTVMNGSMEGGIFRKGKITDLTRFKNTEVIEYEKINYNPNDRY